MQSVTVALKRSITSKYTRINEKKYYLIIQLSTTHSAVFKRNKSSLLILIISDHSHIFLQ